MRLDVYLTRWLDVPSREKAQELIRRGMALVDGRICRKNSTEIPDTARVTLTGSLKYVSRGGWKLERALDVFGIDPAGLRVLDVGASTGGFTDCLLQRGARQVYALDVGHSQLAESLRTDPRVVSLEGVHIRDAGGVLPCRAEMLTCDVSFISLTRVLSYFPPLLQGDDPKAVVLVKPQFEVRHRKSVVRDPALHRQALRGVLAGAEECGFVCRGLIPSPIRGEEGNAEYLLYLALSGPGIIPDIPAAVRKALSGEEERP